MDCALGNSMAGHTNPTRKRGIPSQLPSLARRVSMTVRTRLRDPSVNRSNSGNRRDFPLARSWSPRLRSETTPPWLNHHARAFRTRSARLSQARHLLSIRPRGRCSIKRDPSIFAALRQALWGLRGRPSGRQRESILGKPTNRCIHTSRRMWITLACEPCQRGVR
jgi:hypothetical protein